MMVLGQGRNNILKWPNDQVCFHLPSVDLVIWSFGFLQISTLWLGLIFAFFQAFLLEIQPTSIRHISTPLSSAPQLHPLQITPNTPSLGTLSDSGKNVRGVGSSKNSRVPEKVRMYIWAGILQIWAGFGLAYFGFFRGYIFFPPKHTLIPFTFHSPSSTI